MSNEIVVPGHREPDAPAAVEANVQTPSAASPPVASPSVASPTRRTLLAAGAVTGAGLILGASPGHADILRSARNIIHLDPLVMNFAFEMEELEADFFTRALRSDAYSGLRPREQTLFTLIANEDRDHFGAINDLRQRTGNKGAGHFESRNTSASRQPRYFNFPSKAFDTREGLLQTALDIKETVLYAYHGAVDLVNKDTLLLAAAIAGVEGRHFALLREIGGLDPLPSPFEGALSSQEAGRRLAKYGFRGGGKNPVRQQGD